MKVVGIAVIIVGAVAFGTAAEAGLLDSDPLADDVPDTSGVSEPQAGVGATETADGEVETDPKDINPAAVETHFLELLNAERESRGLQPVIQRDELTALGHDHAENMAKHDYIGHDEPGPGGTIEDRYRERGLLPECRLPTGDGRYYPGTENANGAHVPNYRTTTGEAVSIDDADDLARVLFVEWMDSSGHRRAMLVDSADEAGLGVVIEESGDVYANLELC